VTSPLSRERMRRELEHLAFTAAGASDAPPRIGVEIEMLVVDARDGRPAPIVRDQADAGDCMPTLDWLRPLAARGGWTESRTPKGAPCFVLQDGAIIGFEPGGQLEFSSTPVASASALLARVRAVIGELRDAADDAGIALLHVGIDPWNTIDGVPLQLYGPRYIAMDTYLAARGSAGRRMMRQTAATQVAIDLGPPETMTERWRVLNAAVPCLVAAFANSAHYAGRDTGARSYRSHIWRTLDPSRTGIVESGSQLVDDYLEFALRAHAMFHRGADGEYRPFSHLAEQRVVGARDWAEHLSTLFPEVRPRGYFEVRCTDAVPMEWLPTVIGMIAGIAYDPAARRAALDLLPPTTAETLARAGRIGLQDESIASRARDLARIGLEGCERLGAAFMTPPDLAAMRFIVESRIARAMSPASLPPAATVPSPAVPPRGTPDTSGALLSL
jgi:glutamate--cysteine ligase